MILNGFHLVLIAFTCPIQIQIHFQRNAFLFYSCFFLSMSLYCQEKKTFEQSIKSHFRCQYIPKKTVSNRLKAEYRASSYCGLGIKSSKCCISKQLQHHIRILLKCVSNKNVELRALCSSLNIFIGHKFQQNTNELLGLF